MTVGIAKVVDLIARAVMIGIVVIADVLVIPARDRDLDQALVLRNPLRTRNLRRHPISQWFRFTGSSVRALRITC